MKVKIIKTGEVAEFNDSYAARLIEQGRAVEAPTGVKKPAAVKPAAVEKKG